MAATISIIGLGPGDPALRTIAAQRALDGARLIVLRTRVHPGLTDLADDPRVIDCDDLYGAAQSFDSLYPAIAQRVIDQTAALDEGLVVYAVPGHPRFGERSVPLIEAAAMKAGIEIHDLPAVSAIDAVATTLRIDPLADQVQCLDALSLVAAINAEPFGGGLIALDSRRPVFISQIYSSAIAAALKLALARLYPEDQRVTLIISAGIPGAERIVDCHLYELDRQTVDHLTSVWIPAKPGFEADRVPQTLQQIVAYLRSPAGCPWDRDQTHQSLRSAVIEEAYEVVDAIDDDDPHQLAEELGDLLLQVSLHAQIAEEAGTFLLEDVYQQIAQKLLRRHPHVFGDVTAETPDAVIQTWEAIKTEERAAKPVKSDSSPIGGLPRSMPALQRAAAILTERSTAPHRLVTGDEAAKIGDAILAAAETAVDCNLDPEILLNAALNHRFAVAPTSALMATNEVQKESKPRV